MTIIASLFLVYYGLLVVLYIGWNKALRKQEASGHAIEPIPVTVVIAVRNEEQVIGMLLDDLAKQRYASFDVIIVDDGSEDDTCAEVLRYTQHDPRFRLRKSRGAGKKQALAEGIMSATGSVIVTTDADCRVDEHWLSSLCRGFHASEVNMIFGAVRMDGSSLFAGLQAMEFASLIGSGASAASLGFPIMCNGANLAFRKSVFEETGGYSGNFHIPSGDDEFLMRKFLNRYPGCVRFVPASAAIVTTEPNRDVRTFVNQRLRWAGKWKSNKSLVAKGLALFIGCFQVCVVLLPVLAATGFILPVAALALWLVKVMLELMFLRPVVAHLNIPWRWLPFILLQVIYPFYTAAIGLFSNFRSFEWKGRKLKSLMVSRY